MPRLQKQLICGLFDRVFFVSGGRQNWAVGAEARRNASSRARPENALFVGGAACVPARKDASKTASPPPCTCVGEPAKASTAKKLASVIKDTNHHRFLPKRDEAVADARHHGVTIQRLGDTLYDDCSAWSERQWLQWSGERVSKHCGEDAANALQARRGRFAESCHALAVLRARQQRSAAAGDAHRGRAGDDRSRPRTKHHTPHHTGSPASSRSGASSSSTTAPTPASSRRSSILWTATSA